jgi:glycine/D-amino acid oxidase-like deaminating enzyme
VGHHVSCRAPLALQARRRTCVVSVALVPSNSKATDIAVPFPSLPVAKVNLKAGLNLQTHTPVQSISTASSSSSALWTVNTSRGALQTQTLIVATNGYTSGILPDFRNKIVPVRGTACSITPPASHSIGSLPGPFRMSYGLRFSKGQSDYMIPRQGRGRIPGKGDKSLILGGAKGLFQHDEKVWYDSNRDDQQIEGARKYFEEYGRKHFVGWSGDGSEVDHVWTGSESCLLPLQSRF